MIGIFFFNILGFFYVTHVLVEVQVLGYKFGLNELTYTRENMVNGAMVHIIQARM